MIDSVDWFGFPVKHNYYLFSFYYLYGTGHRLIFRLVLHWVFFSTFSPFGGVSDSKFVVIPDSGVGFVSFGSSCSSSTLVWTGFHSLVL